MTRASSLTEQNCLIKKLELCTRLSRRNEAAAGRRAGGTSRARASFAKATGPRSSTFFWGWACRWKDVPDARGQVVSFRLPGHPCDLDVFVLRQKRSRRQTSRCRRLVFAAARTTDRQCNRTPRTALNDC